MYTLLYKKYEKNTGEIIHVILGFKKVADADFYKVAMYINVVYMYFTIGTSTKTGKF